MRIIAQLSRQQKRKLRRLIQKERDAGMKTRLSIILHLADDERPAAVARALHVARSTVYRVARRYRDGGLAGLADRREDNGGPVVDDSILLELRAIVARSPHAFGWPRATWTQEMLALTLERRTGVKLSRQTIGRCLQAIGARHGRPRPVLRCPWKKAAQTRRIRAIQRLLAGLPPDEVAFYADEVDIHLNPKIGPDWMLPGQQKVVVTPGQNVKRSLAGALDARSGQLLWVADRHKRSGLFIDLVRHLVRRHPDAKRIHLIVDNYSIHSSRQTRLALAELPQVQLHFLPPYSPDFNPIEREWRLLHAEVTRNHCCSTIDELMGQVRRHLAYRNRVKGLRRKRVA
jgi:transposase